MKIIRVILLSIAGISVFIPFVYWLLHPELTGIQVFVKYWWLIVIVILIGYIPLFINDKK